jgi:Spy/CpxP family protein refolding chaperone
MKELSREFQVSTVKLRKQIQFVQQDLRQENRKEEKDQAAIDGLWADFEALSLQLTEAQADHTLAVKAIFTPEQLEQLQQKPARAVQGVGKLQAELRETLMASGEVDAAKVKELQAEIIEQRMTMMKNQSEARSQNRQPVQQVRGTRGMQSQGSRNMPRRPQNFDNPGSRRVPRRR